MKTVLLAAIASFGFAGVVAACPDFNLRANEAYQAAGSQLRHPANGRIDVWMGTYDGERLQRSATDGNFRKIAFS